MSKYIKLEDAEKLLTNALRIAQGFDEPLEKSLADLTTIEVSEDAISRKGLLESFVLSEKTRKYGGDHSGYSTMMLYEIQALLLQTYIQEYGALSDANGEIVRQILMKGVDDE